MRHVAIVLGLLLAACVGPAPASGPGAAILAMRDKFEAEVLAIEKDHANDADGLRRAAMAIALNIYDADWNAVRAETQRSLGALPVLDLAPYESAALSHTVRSMDDMRTPLNEEKEFLTPAGMAMMEFWNAPVVGAQLAAMFVDLTANGEPIAMIGVKLSLVPQRTYRGKFKGADVLAIRYMRSIVVAPYSITAEGMILPDFEKVSVYDLKM